MAISCSLHRRVLPFLKLRFDDLPLPLVRKLVVDQRDQLIAVLVYLFSLPLCKL